MILPPRLGTIAAYSAGRFPLPAVYRMWKGGSAFFPGWMRSSRGFRRERSHD